MSQRPEQQLQAALKLSEVISKLCDVYLRAFEAIEQESSISPSDLSDEQSELAKNFIKGILSRSATYTEQAKGIPIMKSKVLFLAANPEDKTMLKLMQEYREIKHNLQMSTDRDNFQLCTPELSVRKQDLSRRLLQEQPRIVHFSGHGTSNGSLCFVGDDGKSQYVDPVDLDLMFELHAQYIDCVILNACYAIKQAEAISQHINYVIGMRKAIPDRAAIDFTIGFYQALGEGKSIDEAYNYGCALIATLEKTTPILLTKRNKL